MAIDWEIHGMQFGSCNCDYSCPCQFEALPTNGDCRGFVFYRIDRGHFDGVSLDGLKMGLVCFFPGPIPEGHGEHQNFIDSKASDDQRQALLKILRGEEAESISKWTWKAAPPGASPTVLANRRASRSSGRRATNIACRSACPKGSNIGLQKSAAVAARRRERSRWRSATATRSSTNCT